MSCNRELSRIARVLVGEMSEHRELPESCALSAGRDVLLHQETMKKAMRENLWKCRLCGKKFVSEYFLDEHFDRKHSAEIGNVTQPYCLADACGILDCASMPTLARTAFSKRLDQKYTAPRRKRSARFAISCDPHNFDFPEKCRSLFSDCGWDAQAEEHCRALRCDGGRVVLEPNNAFTKINKTLTAQNNGVLLLLYFAFLVLYYFFYICYRVGAFGSSASSFNEVRTQRRGHTSKHDRGRRPD